MTQQSLLIPQMPNGEVDWNTLGNVLTAKIVGEVLCASYIDKKHRMARPQYAVDTDWKYAYEEKDVVILRKEFPDTPYHCWMGRTIIERPLRVIADFLEDPASAMIYDKHIMQSKHLAVLSESETQKDVIAYYFAETRECLVTAKRDFVFYLRHAYTDDKYVLTAMSVDYPPCPPVEGVPRAQLQPGSGWHLERHMGSNARTLVTYVAHTDLIALPPIIANRVLKRQHHCQSCAQKTATEHPLCQETPAESAPVLYQHPSPSLTHIQCLRSMYTTKWSPP
jgi:hypothetical protein